MFLLMLMLMLLSSVLFVPSGETRERARYRNREEERPDGRHGEEEARSGDRKTCRADGRKGRDGGGAG